MEYIQELLNLSMKKIYQNSSIIKFDIFFEPISPTNNQSKQA